MGHSVDVFYSNDGRVVSSVNGDWVAFGSWPTLAVTAALDRLLWTVNGLHVTVTSKSWPSPCGLPVNLFMAAAVITTEPTCSFSAGELSASPPFVVELIEFPFQLHRCTVIKMIIRRKTDDGNFLSLSLTRREAGVVWCLPRIWSLRAVIWFHFTISSLVFLPSPVTLSVLPHFCLLAHSPELFPENSSIFFITPPPPPPV